MPNEETKLAQIAENMRHYGDMRFQQLTLFSGAMALMAAGVANSPHLMLTPRLSVRMAIAVAGSVFTAVILIMEVRSTVYWVAMREGGGQSLWPRPGKSALGRLFNATNAVLFTYFATYFFWMFCASTWSYHPCLVSVVGGLFLLLLLVFTISSYWHMWCHSD